MAGAVSPESCRDRAEQLRALVVDAEAGLRVRTAAAKADMAKADETVDALVAALKGRPDVAELRRQLDEEVASNGPDLNTIAGRLAVEERAQESLRDQIAAARAGRQRMSFPRPDSVAFGRCRLAAAAFDWLAVAVATPIDLFREIDRLTPDANLTDGSGSNLIRAMAQHGAFSAEEHQVALRDQIDQLLGAAEAHLRAWVVAEEAVAAA